MYASGLFPPPVYCPLRRGTPGPCATLWLSDRPTRVVVSAGMLFPFPMPRGDDSDPKLRRRRIIWTIAMVVTAVAGLLKAIDYLVTRFG